MNSKEITSILDRMITETFGELEDWLSRDRDTLKLRTPGEEWSVGEILEHICLADKYLLMLIEKGRRRALKKVDQAAIANKLENYELSDARLEEIGVNDSFEWKPPKHMVPTGTMTLEEIRKELAGQEARLRENLELMKNGEGVLAETAMSVNSLGKLDVYQYIYFLLLHARRHVEQMGKIKEFTQRGQSSQSFQS